MKEKMLESLNKKRFYLCPMVRVFGVEMDSLLTSASGNHNGIGQGTGGGDSKKSSFDLEDDFEDESASVFPSYSVWDNN